MTRSRPKPLVRIVHEATGTVIAEGRRGWNMLHIEGNWYIRRSSLRHDAFRLRPIPGLCVYKGLYLWADINVAGHHTRMAAWKYVLPNPLFFMIWNRFAIPSNHPDFDIEIVSE